MRLEDLAVNLDPDYNNNQAIRDYIDMRESVVFSLPSGGVRTKCVRSNGTIGVVEKFLTARALRGSPSCEIV